MKDPGQEWPHCLSDRARAALARPFVVGRVSAEHCEPGDEPFIGAQAMDLEVVVESNGVRLEVGPTNSILLRSLVNTIEALAARDLIVGTRQQPEVVYSGNRATLNTRIMIAPGKMEAAREALRA